MKLAARIISTLFHPILMPTVGLFLILHSGTYLSLLDPGAKWAILFVMALGTLFFPLMMIPVLYYRNLISTLAGTTREERLIPLLITLILYGITFVYFIRLPLSRQIHGFVLSACILLGVIVLVNLKFRICGHMSALGGIAGLVFSLILIFDTPMTGILLVVLLAAGLTGSARLALGVQKPLELITGFTVGFAVVLITLLVY
jgi:hypothetical protein